MKRHAVLLVGLVVLLGGCLGGAGGVVFGDGDQGETTTQPTTTNQGTTTMDSATTDQGGTTLPATEGGDGTTLPATENEDRTTLPATTDADRNVTATFVGPDDRNVTVTLMVADEPDERQQGLMYRQSLPDRTGMVFVYDDAAPRTFWMKNTYVPLDIVFVAPNGTVLNVEHAQAQPHAPDSEVDRYSSEGDATYVVELERGFANRTGIGPGSELVFNATAPEAGSETASVDELEHKAFKKRA